jgi:hypothetical protein
MDAFSASSSDAQLGSGFGEKFTWPVDTVGSIGTVTGSGSGGQGLAPLGESGPAFDYSAIGRPGSDGAADGGKYSPGGSHATGPGEITTVTGVWLDMSMQEIRSALMGNNTVEKMGITESICLTDDVSKGLGADDMDFTRASFATADELDSMINIA